MLCDTSKNENGGVLLSSHLFFVIRPYRPTLDIF
nr:MAG TPA: hypothetical protein [Caudoviricetes sp.]